MKQCVDLVNHAKKHRQRYLKFRGLLAQCYRDANMCGCGVVGSSSSNKRMRSGNAAAISGATLSQKKLHLKMASLVRDKLIEQATVKVQRVAALVQQLRAQGNVAGATQKEKLRLQLMQQRDHLKQTDLGWRMAWGVVDRALAGMDFFRGTFHLPFAHYPPLPHSHDSGMRVGDDEAAMLRCFHDVQDLFLAGTLSSLLSSY